MDNEQLIHIWANKGHDRRSGNLSIRSGDLYSYEKLIGKHFEGFTLIQSSEGFSVTTSRHISLAYRSVSHLAVYFADNLRFIERLSIEGIGKQLFNEYSDKIDNDLKSLSRARSHIVNSFNRIRELAHDACKLFVMSNQDRIPAYEWLLVLANSNNASYSISSADTYLLEQLQARYNLDLLKKLNNEKLADSRKEEQRKLQALKRIEDQKQNAIKWRAHKFPGNLFDLPVMLRIIGDEIQTSHGATVPLKEAYALYQAHLSGNSITNYRIGHFTVTHVNDEYIKIGCHTIPMQEVKDLLG
jgi:hypothetical protein